MEKSKAYEIDRRILKLMRIFRKTDVEILRRIKTHTSRNSSKNKTGKLYQYLENGEKRKLIFFTSNRLTRERMGKERSC